MPTYYLIDGGCVRAFKNPFNMTNVQMLWKWIKVAPTTRSVYTVKEDKWYRLMSNGWSTRTTPEPKPITMSRMVQAITKTTYKEITSEIPADTF